MLASAESSDAPKLWKGRNWAEREQEEGWGLWPITRPLHPSWESPLEARSGPKRAGGSTRALRCGKPVPHQSAHEEPCPNDHHFRCSPGSDSSCPQSSASATPFPAGPSSVQLPPAPGLQSRFSPAKHGQQLAWPRPRCPPPLHHTLCRAGPPFASPPLASPHLPSPPFPSPPLLSLPFPPAARPPSASASPPAAVDLLRCAAPDTPCPRPTRVPAPSGSRAPRPPHPAPLPGAGGRRGSAMTGHLWLAPRTPAARRKGWESTGAIPSPTSTYSPRGGSLL